MSYANAMSWNFVFASSCVSGWTLSKLVISIQNLFFTWRKLQMATDQDGI